MYIDKYKYYYVYKHIYNILFIHCQINTCVLLVKAFIVTPWAWVRPSLREFVPFFFNIVRNSMRVTHQHAWERVQVQAWILCVQNVTVTGGLRLRVLCVQEAAPWSACPIHKPIWLINPPSHRFTRKIGRFTLVLTESITFPIQCATQTGYTSGSWSDRFDRLVRVEFNNTGWNTRSSVSKRKSKYAFLFGPRKVSMLEGRESGCFFFCRKKVGLDDENYYAKSDPILRHIVLTLYPLSVPYLSMWHF